MTVPAVHPAQTPAAGDAAAELRGVHIGFRSGRRVTPVVRGVDLRLRRGRVLALVGESGSGKSLTSLALIGLLPPGAEVTSGSVVLTARTPAGSRRGGGARCAAAASRWSSRIRWRR